MTTHHDKPKRWPKYRLSTLLLVSVCIALSTAWYAERRRVVMLSGELLRMQHDIHKLEDRIYRTLDGEVEVLREARDWVNYQRDHPEIPWGTPDPELNADEHKMVDDAIQDYNRRWIMP